MIVECPACGSHRTRLSRRKSLGRFFLRAFDIHSVRCRACMHSFYWRPFSPVSWFWARCPRCFRMDLAKWSPHRYRAPLSMRVKLVFGARPWRCEACRTNFVSFRMRKEEYRGWRKKENGSK